MLQKTADLSHKRDGDFYKSVEKVISGTGGKVWRYPVVAAAGVFPRSEPPGYRIPGCLDLAAGCYRIRLLLGRINY